MYALENSLAAANSSSNGFLVWSERLHTYALCLTASMGPHRRYNVNVTVLGSYFSDDPMITVAFLCSHEGQGYNFKVFIGVPTDLNIITIHTRHSILSHSRLLPVAL